jgi:release factor glutamine methyltransferase
VRELEKEEMQNNVIDHEPGLALFVPDEDPLKFYSAVVNFAADHLNEDGCFYLEINQYLGKEMMNLLEESNFKTIELRKDMFGNDRMIKGIRK